MTKKKIARRARARKQTAKTARSAVNGGANLRPQTLAVQEESPEERRKAQAEAVSWVHDAIDALAEVRRADAARTVSTFRGEWEIAKARNIDFLEALARVDSALVRLDLDLPRGAS